MHVATVKCTYGDGEQPGYINQARRSCSPSRGDGIHTLLRKLDDGSDGRAREDKGSNTLNPGEVLGVWECLRFRGSPLRVP